MTEALHLTDRAHTLVPNGDQERPAAVQGDGDEAHRVRLGAHVETAPHVLTGLAADPSVTVRAALAMNPATPPAAIDLLVRDSDVRVRALLAKRLAALMPSLDEAAQSQIYPQVMAALSQLVEDEASRVRAAIADAVREMPEAPRELVLRLAHDSTIEVAEPVIRLSPLLTQADLLALLAHAGTPAVAIAVARRPHLTEVVADAIAASANSDAIRELLSNQSAQIREATLDALIAAAAEHVAWHEPLVRRPDLSPRAAQALSRIVADTLLAELANRADVGPAVTEVLRARVSRHLAYAPGTMPTIDPGLSDALAQARALAEDGKLTEATLLEATSRGDARMAAAMLAVAADVSYALVERAASLRSAKGLVSLAWKAGFGMRTAVVVQSLMARLAPNAVLQAGPGGTFPLSIEEMRWQIEFLAGRTV